MASAQVGLLLYLERLHTQAGANAKVIWTTNYVIMKYSQNSRPLWLYESKFVIRKSFSQFKKQENFRRPRTRSFDAAGSYK